MRTTEARTKIYATLGKTVEKFHFAPLDEGLHGKKFHKNLVLMTLSFLLNKNHLLMGEPGWGKTTGAKILSAQFTGVPYCSFDALEIRGNPQKYEEKIVGRPDYGQLNQGREAVVWQGTFGLPVLIVDEGNRLPLDSQDVILQGIDTGRWNYMNSSLYEGKKPTFITMNERTGNHENGFLPALKDRLDIVTEQGFYTTMDTFDYDDARRAVETELCNAEFTTALLQALSKSYGDYKAALSKREIEGHLTAQEKQAAQEQIRGLELDNDGMLFLQAFMAEINYSNQYGSKRVSDPISPDSHDKGYAGVHVSHSFSPRSAMATEAYAKALAWFLNESPTIDHVRFVLPHIFAHKAGFTDDYRNQKGNDVRKTSETLHLAITLVKEVFERYEKSIQPMKNFIARLQRQDITDAEIAANEIKLTDGGKVSLNEDQHDHPLMKDFVREAKNGDNAAFYEGE